MLAGRGIGERRETVGISGLRRSAPLPGRTVPKREIATMERLKGVSRGLRCPAIRTLRRHCHKSRLCASSPHFEGGHGTAAARAQARGKTARPSPKSLISGHHRPQRESHRIISHTTPGIRAAPGTKHLAPSCLSDMIVAACIEARSSAVNANNLCGTHRTCIIKACRRAHHCRQSADLSSVSTTAVLNAEQLQAMLDEMYWRVLEGSSPRGGVMDLLVRPCFAAAALPYTPACGVR